MLKKTSLQLYVALALAALSFLLFLPSLGFDFVSWDDDLAIYANPLIRNLSSASVLHIMFDVKQIIRYMPFSHLSWAVLYHFFGLHPWPYHFINVFLHAISAGLLCCIFNRLLRLSKFVNAHDQKLVIFLSFIGASLWAFHPLRVEVVSRASDFTYCSSTAFLLLSFYTYLRAKEAAAKRVAYWLSVFFFAVSFLFFPVAIGAAGIFILLDIFPMELMPLDPRKWLEMRFRILWVEKIPFFLITAFAVFINLYAESAPEGVWRQMLASESVPLLLRLARAAYMGMYYIWIQILPLNLVPTNPILHDLALSSPSLLLSLAGVIGISAVLLLCAKKHPGSLIAWLTHWLLIAPILGLGEQKNFPIPCDRYAQFDSMLWAFVVVVLVYKFCQKIKTEQKNILVVGLAAAALFYASMTLPQQLIWKDSVSLFEYTFQKLPECPYRLDIEWRLGKAYMVAGASEKGVAHLEHVIKVRPRNAMITALAAYANELSGRISRAQELYQIVLRLPASNDEYKKFSLVRLSEIKRAK